MTGLMHRLPVHTLLSTAAVTLGVAVAPATTLAAPAVHHHVAKHTRRHHAVRHLTPKAVHRTAHVAATTASVKTAAKPAVKPTTTTAAHVTTTAAVARTATIAATTTTTTAPSSAWGEPALVNPITINVTPATNLALPQNQDYILQCPTGTMVLTDTFKVWGGHNVVLQNCNFELSISGWAGKFENQSGTLWIHDVHFGGVDLTGGLQLQEPGATVVMRDVLFDTVYGSYSTNHAELIQTWSGPARLLIDGLSGATTYQGLFLLPNQFNYSTGPAPTVFDLRNINIDDTQGAYALWLGYVHGAPSLNQAAGIATFNVAHVFVNPNPARTWTGWWLWPKPSSGDPTWNGVSAGVPASGSYVTATPNGATGVDEGVSPTPLTGEQP